MVNFVIYNNEYITTLTEVGGFTILRPLQNFEVVFFITGSSDGSTIADYIEHKKSGKIDWALIV